MITYFQYLVPFKIVQYVCYGHTGLTYANFFVLVVCLVSCDRRKLVFLSLDFEANSKRMFLSLFLYFFVISGKLYEWRMEWYHAFSWGTFMLLETVFTLKLGQKDI